MLHVRRQYSRQSEEVATHPSCTATSVTVLGKFGRLSAVWLYVNRRVWLKMDEA